MGATLNKGVLQQLAVAMMTMMILILLISTDYECEATATSDQLLINSNATNIIGDQDLDVEFQMDSEINRRILALKASVVKKTLDKGAAGCGRTNGNQRYTPCSGPNTGTGQNYCRDSRNRNC
ncbi:hypothetical protein CsatA_017051 [Cannabis sativa]